MEAALQVKDAAKGKTATPELYIAVGISGSPQHVCGANGSKYIAAINKDPDANIFREAHFAVVGDWKKVLPAFSEKLRVMLEEYTKGLRPVALTQE